MSVLEVIKETITGKSAPAPSLRSVEIAKKFAEAQAAIPDLEVRHADLAFRCETGEATERDVAVALGELRAARDRAASLAAALGRAHDVEAQEAAAKRAAVHKSQIAAVRAQFRTRDAAVAKMIEHLEAAVAEYEKAVGAAAKAAAAAPGGMPRGVLVERVAFNRAIQVDLYRLSARLIGGDAANAAARAFPGAVAPSVTLAGQPGAIAPLVDLVKTASDYALRVLTGRTPAPLPVATPEPPAPETPSAGEATMDARDYVPPKRRVVL